MTLEFDFSGFGLRLNGEDPVLQAVASQWADFAGSAARTVIEVRVETGDRQVPAGRRMEGVVEDRRIPTGRRLAQLEGEIEVHGAHAVLRLHQADEARRLWGAINLLAQAMGHALPRDGGLLVHGAAVVVDGRAFLLTGPSGAGKTTWARACAAAGLPVLSDDVVLLHADLEHPCALGSPLRARDFPSPGRGRWPLAGLLLARHGTPALAPTPLLRMSAVLQANALFVLGADPRVGELLNHLLARVPARELTFAPDPSFVPLLRSFGR